MENISMTNDEMVAKIRELADRMEMGDSIGIVFSIDKDGLTESGSIGTWSICSIIGVGNIVEKIKSRFSAHIAESLASLGSGMTEEKKKEIEKASKSAFDELAVFPEVDSHEEN
jgi:hypothetical protein